ncbi:MAG: CopD family protein [Bacteroidetes bacterium]|nr:CopD family protein [Bacteroidota bacterium]MBU1373807.1 CopD family protein [Bacteroidota bacterium]MBU1483854.1 CopD family protein [Bacteroidota bacterium]MBU1761054.1 CopD family protein [Bacteroidota bacterium]MBU2268658.1 CopD family protein [Bacteroidota bacterium]
MYQYILALHIIFVVSWMAGLFYIVRLFIYHTEANEKPEPDRTILQKQFVVMESKLWNIITTPAMILAVAAGMRMLQLNSSLLETDWMWVKLAFVAGLLIYHFICQNIISQLKRGRFWMTSTQLRLWNELATIFLVAIVFTVILKSAIDWIYGLLGLAAFAIIIMIAVKIYKRRREKASN